MSGAAAAIASGFRGVVTVDAAPGSLSWVFFDDEFVDYWYTASATATATGGSGSYTYAWTSPDALVATPTLASTTFQVFSGPPSTTAICTVTDSLGVVGVSNTVTISP